MTTATPNPSATSTPDTDSPRIQNRSDLPLEGRTERLLRTRVPRTRHRSTAWVEASLTTGPWSQDADGRGTALSAAALLDNTLGQAVHTADSDLGWIVTTELQLTLAGAFPADGTVLTARLQPIAADPRGGAARGSLYGPDGTEYAHATGWFHAVDRSSEDALDRYARQAARPLGPETEVPLPQLVGMTGAAPARADARPAVTADFQSGVAFREDDGLKNPHGAIHGGALTIMAGLAAQQALPDRTGYDLQSLQIRFLRPATGPLAARTRVRHAGRTLRLVEVELVPDTGTSAEAGPAKPVIEAMATFRAAA